MLEVNGPFKAFQFFYVDLCIFDRDVFIHRFPLHVLQIESQFTLSLFKYTTDNYREVFLIGIHDDGLDASG